jgi:hypothetical protein
MGLKTSSNSKLLAAARPSLVLGGTFQCVSSSDYRKLDSYSGWFISTCTITYALNLIVDTDALGSCGANIIAYLKLFAVSSAFEEGN